MDTELNDRRLACLGRLQEASREDLINIISDLFPADAVYDSTAQVGRELLAAAREECVDWRREPLDVLKVYARKCIELEFRREP